MRLPTLIFCLLSCIAAQAQNFFAPDSIRTVEIFFAEENWDYLLDSMATNGAATGTGQGRLMGSVVIDGVPFDSCGVRYKGNSTYSPSNDKNPLNIDLNWIVPGQRYMGVDKIKLANQINDPVFIREPLMYELAGNYMHAPRANHCKVWINGDYKGLYCNTENVGNEFLDAHFGSSDNPFFKCDPVLIGLGGNSNLAYLPDSNDYAVRYDMKSDYGLEALQELCYELETNPGAIADHLDVDRVLWFHALSNIYVHMDGYMAFAHNYYMYKDHHDRWSPVLWDLNLSFGGLPFDGQGIWPMNTQGMQRLRPDFMIDKINSRPLIAQILKQPRYFRMYLAHYNTIKEETVDNDFYWERAQYWHAQADSIYQYEPYANFSYPIFQDNLYNNVGVFFTLQTGIFNLMSERKNYLDTIQLLNQPHPEILSYQVLTESPSSYSPVVFNATVNGADTVLLGYRQGKFDRFYQVQMYDDGLHNDGPSGDGVYGVTILPGAGDIQYYIFADNATGARFSPPRAEFEFHEVLLTSPLVLNEVQSNNTSTVQDQNQEFDDWVELYNNSDQTLALEGHFLSDDSTDIGKWAFPDTSIAPGAFLIVWADDDGGQTGLHANFKLATGGEDLLLTGPNGAKIDKVALPAMSPDEAYGRLPNGTGPWQILFPTFGEDNSDPDGVDQRYPGMEVSVYPNPSRGGFWIDLVDVNDTRVRELRIMDTTGRYVHVGTFSGSRQWIDLSDRAGGLYFVRVGDTVKRIVKR